MRFGLFCKSFRRDRQAWARLLGSILRHQRQPIPTVLCVPQEDRELFAEDLPAQVRLVTDEQVLGYFLPQSWHAQQVVKLNAWRLDFADAFLVLDSDFLFLRDFGPEDFVSQEEPVFVLSRHCHEYPGPAPPERLEECRRLCVPRERWGTLSRVEDLLNRVFDFSYARMQKRIRRVFRRPGADFYCMPGPVWTRALGQAFQEQFLEPRGLTAEAVVRYSPWEALWLAEFALAAGLVRQPRPPYFLSFPNDEAVGLARERGFTAADLPPGYLGVTVAAGHCRQQLF